MSDAQRVWDAFKTHFSGKPLMVRSPGRVNLLGEHTDYNLGFVLPGAIDRAIWFALAPRTDRSCRLMALDLDQRFECSFDQLRRSPFAWPDYLMGVIDQLQKMGREPAGFDCVFGGDIPLGAGLSSSAALEAGLAFALNHLFQLGLDRLTMVKLAQKAENEFVGVQCGIMDQYINIFGSTGHVLQIDCRSLDHIPLPFEFPSLALVLFNSQVSHSLAATEYNKRRLECSEGVAVIKRVYPEVESLRDVKPAMLTTCSGDLKEPVYRRCRYVVAENERMERVAEALAQRDAKAFGRLMFETHIGLRDDYQVSCPELDFLVDAVAGQPGVFGARMMGGGFGGCTLNLMARDAVAETSQRISAAYRRRFGIETEVIVTSIAAGTAVLEAGTWT